MSGTSLSQQVNTPEKWPTPRARIWKGGGERYDTQGWKESFGYVGLGGGVSDWWEAEPAVGRVVDGMACRVDRLKAIGNGQVPLCAAHAFRTLHGGI